jgi:hypothetical protein
MMMKISTSSSCSSIINRTNGDAAQCKLRFEFQDTLAVLVNLISVRVAVNHGLVLNVLGAIRVFELLDKINSID